MSGMTVQVSARTDKTTGAEYFEGTVTVAGIAPTKLTKNDGSTRYTSRSQVTQAARRLADRLLLVYNAEATTDARKAAKKSVKTKKPACNGGSCCF